MARKYPFGQLRQGQKSLHSETLLEQGLSSNQVDLKPQRSLKHAVNIEELRTGEGFSYFALEFVVI